MLSSHYGIVPCEQSSLLIITIPQAAKSALTESDVFCSCIQADAVGCKKLKSTKDIRPILMGFTVEAGDINKTV